MLSKTAAVSRFEILEELGRGGMGTVYRGYDPTLDREVAIKVLGDAQPQFGPGTTFDLRSGIRGDEASTSKPKTVALSEFGDSVDLADLRNEARAMARLSHRNVVSIYEMGESQGCVFLILELVEGRTLRQWLAQEKPAQAAIFAAFRQAASGLAAAHDAGIVHRDVKPENLLIDSDDVVRVSDFGLAINSRRPSSSMVRRNAIAGTPPYMAPELMIGEEPSKASDIYAFCASLFEALGGTVPLESTNQSNITTAVADLGKLPPRLRRLLVQGLSHDQDARQTNMHELASALDPPRSRRAFAAIGLALVAAGGAGVFALSSSAGSPPCDSSWPRLDSVWNEEVSSRVLSRLSGEDVSLSPRTTNDVAKRVQRQVDLLRQIRHETCLDNHRKLISDVVAVARTNCFGDQVIRLRASIDSLSRVTPKNAKRVLATLGSIEEVEQCTTRSAILRDRVHGPEADGLRGDFEELSAEVGLSGVPSAEQLEAFERLVQRGRNIADPNLLARILQKRGKAFRRADEKEKARASHQEAVASAIAAGNDRLASIATIDVANIAANTTTTNVEEANAMLALAESSLARIPDDHAVRALFYNVKAGALDRQSRLDEAEEAIEKALDEASKRKHKIGNIEQAIKHRYAFILSKRGKHEEALNFYRATMKSVSERLGPEHSRIASYLANIGAELMLLDRSEEAIAAFDRAVSICEKTRCRIRYVLEIRHRKAIALEKLRRWNDALAVHQKVLDARLKRGKKEADTIASSHFQMGQINVNIGETAKAQSHLAAAYEQQLARWGPKSLQIASTIFVQGAAALQRSQFAEARRLYKSARQIRAQVLGLDAATTRAIDPYLADLLIVEKNFKGAHKILVEHIGSLREQPSSLPVDIARAQIHLGKTLLGLNQAKAAIAPLREAMAGLSRYKEEAAVAGFHLGRALHATGERTEGRALARAALPVVENTEYYWAKRETKDIAAWLRDNGL